MPKLRVNDRVWVTNDEQEAKEAFLYLYGNHMDNGRRHQTRPGGVPTTVGAASDCDTSLHCLRGSSEE